MNSRWRMKVSLADPTPVRTDLLCVILSIVRRELSFARPFSEG